MEEKIGSLKQVSGHTYDTIYNLLFTTDRVIAMILRHPLDISPKPNVTSLLFGNRNTRRGERVERVKIEENRLSLYEEQTFDELAAGHEFNFEIPYDKVERAKLTRGFFDARLVFHLFEKLDGKSKILFNFPKKQSPEAGRILERAIPAKINIPKK